MTREEAIKAIIEIFGNDEELFNDCIEELDSYNGWLGDGRYYPMCELDEFYSGCDVIEILNRAYFGYDAKSWHTDNSGNKIYEAFCPNRKYFSFNGYGNLVSSDYKDYSDRLDDYTVEEMIDNAHNIWSFKDNDDIQAILDNIGE